MLDHHHDGCPHDHEGEACPFPVVAAEVEPAETAVEEVQILADASVEIAEIEAEVELAQIETSLEHHEIEAETELAQIEASLEHHEIEAEHDDEIVEEVEELAEVVEELEEVVVEDLTDEAGAPSSDDEPGEEDGDAISVLPPPRVEAPGASTKAPRRQSKFTARHSRRR